MERWREMERKLLALAKSLLANFNFLVISRLGCSVLKNEILFILMLRHEVELSKHTALKISTYFTKT